MTVISVEGGPRSGKTLMLTLMAYIAWENGLQVVSNFPLRFPEREGCKVPLYRSVTDLVDPYTYEFKFEQKDCFHARHEFYTEVESRSMGNTRFRYAVLDWVMQLGKYRSSIAWDAQDYFSVDKRLRTIVVQRVWALKSFHRPGDSFSYVFYDRTTREAFVVEFPEEHLSFLYPLYDTTHRAKREFVVYGR